MNRASMFLQRLLVLNMFVFLLISSIQAQAESIDMEMEARNEFIQQLFSAAAGTTYEMEKELCSSMDADAQDKRMVELGNYRTGVRNWLLSAFGAEVSDSTELLWMVEESYRLLETTESGRVFLDKLEEMKCAGITDSLELTQIIVRAWLDEIDHVALSGLNKDYSFWIYCPNSAIDYPVVQGSDNEYYLKRLFNGERNACGTLFVDYRNLPEFADPNTLIYGHHMRDGSMFKSLSYYKEKEYFVSHPYFLIIAPEAIYLADVIAGYTTSANDHCYDIALSDKEDLQQFIEEALKKSDFDAVFDAAVDIDEVDRLITLSTCAYSFENARYIVICKLTMVVDLTTNDNIDEP